MILREMDLPPGWYPRERGKIEEFLGPFLKNDHSEKGCAAIAPHAGWYYSGLTAALAVSSLDPEAGTVIVIGGHLPERMPVLMAEEDGVKTPLGTMKIDIELREELRKLLKPKPDQYSDNTVEVLLPMVHFYFPKAEILWLRFPAGLSSFSAGGMLADAAASIGRRITVLASTDLTHYGANYWYSPKGSGKAALDWVKNVNDYNFIGAVLEGEPSQVLKRADEDFSACSAGAVLGTLGFAAKKAKKAKLLDYRTSADAGRDLNDSRLNDPDYSAVPDSFVGYAAISFA